MCFLLEENTNFPIFQPHFGSVEHRPMLLKDYLKDDGQQQFRWSTGGKSKKLPRIVLLRSWSKRAAATKMSAVHKVMKLLHFASSIKTPSALPRSISRKLSRRGKTDIFGDEVKVKVKDILRWRSFRDIAEDEPSPLDYPRSPDGSCNRSSWCDSDFTAEESPPPPPPWGGENENFKNTKEDWPLEEYDQQSPVSVLDSPFRQVKEFISPFHPTSTNNLQRAKCGLTRRIHLEEEANATEEKAKQFNEDGDGVIIDFLTSELSINGKLNDDEILKMAKSWLEGEFEDSYEWEVEEKRGSFVKDMEKGISWKNFREEEEEELCKEMEIRLLNDLLDDFVADFLNYLVKNCIT